MSASKTRQRAPTGDYPVGSLRDRRVVVWRNANFAEPRPCEIHGGARYTERVGRDHGARLAKGHQRSLEIAVDVIEGRYAAVDEGKPGRVLEPDTHLPDLSADGKSRRPLLDHES